MDGKAWVGGTIGLLVIGGLVVTRLFFYQLFTIPSAAMEATLQIGDYVVLSKRAYVSHPPERGDVVIFKMPNPNSPDYGSDYVKRVIGLPGDRIQVTHSHLFINGRDVPRTRIADYVETVDGVDHHVEQSEEHLPGGRTDQVLDREPDGQLDNTGVYAVPPGHYFVMGDNRDNSDDSRDHVGYVPADAIEGRVVFRVSPASQSWQPIH